MVIFSLAFTPIAKYLFNNNAAGKVDIVDAKGKSPLLKACVNNHLAVVKLLVDKYHADVNLPDSEVSYIKGLFHIFPYFIFAGKHSSFLCYQKRPY